jgi:ribosomal protein RSM22 (predicted rRNA methylase)
MRRALVVATGRWLVTRHDVCGSRAARSGTAVGARWASSASRDDALTAVVEDRSVRAISDGDDDDAPPVLPAALRSRDDLVSLLTARDGDAFLDGVHRLSTRSEGIVELPETLQNAVRVAVRDTGATHRQVKAKGRSLLDALKAASRGVISLDGGDADGGDDASVKSWLRERRDEEAADDPLGFGGMDGTLGPRTPNRMRDVEWGVRLSQKRHARIMEGLAENAAARERSRDQRGKAKERSAPSAATYGPLEAAAYAVARLPMTFGAQRRVFRELRDRCPAFEPKTLLEFGAGPAPALWAARDVFGGGFGVGGACAGSATLVDASPSMMSFARRVAKSAADESDLRELGEGMGFLSRPSGRPLPEPHPWGESGAVKTVASLRAMHSKAAFDLVVAAYALGELDAPGGTGGTGEGAETAARRPRDENQIRRRADETVAQLWSRVAPGGALVLVEPGTPNGSRLIRRARQRVLDSERDTAARLVTSDDDVDAHVVAPCQHDRACPMDGLPTWCHFSQRVQRSEMHRQMLPRGRGAQHQDERFSYVILRRLSRARARQEDVARAEKVASGKWLDVLPPEEEEDEEANMSAEEIAERRAIEKRMGFSRDADDVVAATSREDESTVDAIEADEDGDDAEEDEDAVPENPLADAVALASAHEWGRMVRPPIKRSGHVIVDLCDADGKLSRQIIAKSNAWEGGVGKSGYKAARKSKWGDLWAYDDPRRLTETRTLEEAAELRAFFSDFADLDADELADLEAGRETPVGVGGVKKPFGAKRPEIVERFVAMEREHGIETLAEMMDERDGGDGEGDERGA